MKLTPDKERNLGRLTDLCNKNGLRIVFVGTDSIFILPEHLNYTPYTLFSPKLSLELNAHIIERPDWGEIESTLFSYSLEFTFSY